AGVPLLAIFLLIHHVTISPAEAAYEPITIAAIVLLYIGIVPNTINYGLTALFYAFEKAEVPAAVTTISVILKAVLGLGALLAGWGAVGLAGVSILINLSALVILGTQVRRLIRENVPVENSRTRVERALMRDMIIASWPLMLNNLLAGM